MASKSIAIIGGGITGLSSAWLLEQRGYTDITILEASSRLGGKIRTERDQGFLIENGPDALMTSKAGVRDFIKDLGLEEQLIEPKSRQFYVLHKGHLKSVPAGFASMVPADLRSFWKTDLLSWRGKLRLMMERFIKSRNSKKDESLAHFVRRRFGKEVLDKMAEPLFTGVYSAPADQLSIRATFPNFKQMESKYGSITKAVMATRKKQGVPQSSPFRSFKAGMQTLPDTIINQLESTKVFRNTTVSSIHKVGSGYQLHTQHKSVIPVDAMIVTIPSYQAGTLLNSLSPGIEEKLCNIPHATSAIVTLAFNREQVKMDLDATGFLIPSSEKTQLSACTWSSEKWEGRAPEDMVTFRCFFSNIDKGYLQEWPKDDWTKIAENELKNILSIEGNPEKAWFHTWQDAQPQYKMGHLKTLRSIEKALTDYPGIYLAGSPYRGVGIPDCIRQAKEVVEDLQT